MKKIVKLVIVLSLLHSFSFAQSIGLNPESLDLPKVSTLPGCTPSDYGKVVFLTTNNKAHVGSGSGWVVVEPSGGGGGSLTLPYNATGAFSSAGFLIQNTAGGINSAAIQGMANSALNGAYGVLGTAVATSPSGNNAGIGGINNSTNANGSGVYGRHDGGGNGVFGESLIGKGVYGLTSSSGDAVFGQANNLNARAGVFVNTAQGGIALRTTGALRFEGQNAGAGRFLRSLDNLGTAAWANITRTEILKIPSAGFTSHISSNDVVYDGKGVYFSGTSGTGSLHAPLILPNGATVTNVKFYYIDGDATLGMTAYSFQKMDHTPAGAQYANVSSGSIPNANNALQVSNVSQNVSEVIDNSTTFYRLVFTMPFDVDLKLIGAEVQYTYQVNN